MCLGVVRRVVFRSGGGCYVVGIEVRGFIWSRSGKGCRVIVRILIFVLKVVGGC